MSQFNSTLKETMESKYDSDDEQPKKRPRIDILDEPETSNFEENKIEESIEDDKYKRCQGCIEDQPNQMAHMEPGGCLYIDYFISDSSDTEEEHLNSQISEESSKKS